MSSMIIYNLIFGLFIIMLVFLILDKHTSGTIIADTVTDLNDTDTSLSQNLKGTVNIFKSVWTYIPFFAFFGVIFYAIAHTQGED